MSILEATKTKAARTKPAGTGRDRAEQDRDQNLVDATATVTATPQTETTAEEYREQDARALAVHANDDRAQRLTTSTDIFGDYLHKIGVSPLLTAEQEVTLARDIEIGVLARDRLEHTVGDPTLCRELAWLVHAGEVAKRRFIESNLRDRKSVV